MKKYKVSDQQVSTSVSGKTVILNYGSGMYFNLDEVGTCIWHFIQKEPASLAKLVEEVCQEFDVIAATAETDLSLLLENLLHEKLISEVS